MSINVTVRGNPISIKRGKMVTHDADSEFEHRRLMRLQQVRDQSKEIAADVLNRVRKEKEKQLNTADKKGEQDLKRWQAKKISALQKQYQDSLKEIGSAQAKAAGEPDDNEVLRKQSKKHHAEAITRQEIASSKQQKEEKEKETELKKPAELKKKVRKFEDARAAMVTKLNQKPEKKRKRPKVKSGTDSSFLSDRENISPRSPKDKRKMRIIFSSPEYSSDSSASNKSRKSPTSSPRKSPTSSPRKSPRKSPTSSPKKSAKSKKIDSGISQTSKITKISDRIKQRKPKLQANTYELVDIPSETRFHPDLPYVPTTTLAPESIGSKKDKPLVQKVTKESIRVNPPSDRSETPEIIKLSNKRDKEAHDRGIRAMEKERIEKDFKQLMEELPLLQKQERLAQMRKHNPAFHMPGERLEELERRKQNKIENVFEKYYYRSKALETPLITVPPVLKPLPGEELKLPYETLDLTEESNTHLNVAEWTTEDIPSAQCIPEQDRTGDKQKDLIELLHRVNRQRELLLQEVSTLPASSNLQKIIKEDELLKLICPKKSVATSTLPCPEKTKKRAPAFTTSSDSSAEVKRKQKRKKTHKKQKIVTTNATQTSPSIQKTKHSDMICSCKSTTSGPCDCQEKLLKTRKSSSTGNICRVCGQEFEIRHENERKHSQKIYKCLCSETEKENTHRKQKDVQTKMEDTDRLCEIIIKASNQADVKIHKEEEKTAGKKVILNLSKPYNINIRPGNDISSSTTYVSPPDGFQRMKHKSSRQKKHQDYKDLLHSKPKQSNIDTSDSCYPSQPTTFKPKKSNIDTSDSYYPCQPTTFKPKKSNIETSDSCYPCQQTTSEDKRDITPSLLRYIQKLLSMSRQSIDELTISSISEVSTPQHSVIDVAENIADPCAQLQNVMEYYGLSLCDIQKLLSTPEKKVEFPSANESTTQRPRNYENVAEIVRETFDLQTGDMEDIPLANIVSMTKTHCERINQLSDRIDQVRREKERILSPNISDRYDTSLTSYLELPKMLTDSNRSNKSSSSSSRSVSQEELNKYLLAVERVPSPKSRNKRNTSPKNTKKETDSATTSNTKKQQPSIECPCPTVSSISIFQDINEVPSSDKNFQIQNQPFVPMLQGIPRYTNPSEAQASNFLNSPVKQFLLNNKTKPPPALLRNATRFNLDMTPHELSTIQEMDTVSEVVSTQQGTEIKLIKSPSKEACTPCSDEIDKAKKSSMKKACSSASEKSTSSPEDMETALRNIGMSWAVATMKKTKEALALSSSSSSLEASFRKRVSFQESNSTSSSNSEIREALSKELRKKMSLSNSPRLSPDLSEIRDPTIFRDSQHRTSTPVQNSKSTDSKKDLFPNDSDISSVKMYCEELFLSIPNVSLDTSKSLSRSKE